ncbi:hypothetical protein SSX86_029769 [Deinandra increscens subsp. villosa]|uniref:Uncharacterized protein n=1 Tax=Deinandra increscens subsp. villosa TaxID=3103831 RepID=A0AAP0CH36_9ASTR
MEGKEEDVKLGANKFSERQPIGTSAQTDKDYKEPPPAPLFEPGELSSWSFYRAGIAEFIATFLFLYISVLTVMGVVKSPTKCGTVGIQGIAWAFGGMIFALVYCTAGISGGHINPAVTFGLLLARKLSLTRAVFYMVMQCLGAICGAGVVKGFQDFGSFTNWICGFLGPFGHHPDHRNRYQPRKKSWSCNHLQQGPRLGRPLDFLGWTLHWSCTCCSVSPDCHQGHSFQEQILRNKSLYLFDLLSAMDCCC